MIWGHGGNIHAAAAELGCRESEIVDMSSNVNPLGPPPGLLAHLKAQIHTVCALPEVDAGGMTAAFARRYGLCTQNVLAANGTTHFIYSLPRALGTRRALIMGPTYADYAAACESARVPFAFWHAGATNAFFPDLEEAWAQNRDADTLFFCNPNNPTGTLLPPAAIAGFCRRHPQVRVVLDESYLPFAAPAKARTLIDARINNLIVLNSLSKIFRIPGLRIGFLSASGDVISALDRFAVPWNVNALAQVAVKYLMSHTPETEAFIARSREHIEAERRCLQKRLGAVCGLSVFPSETSFVLLKLPDRHRAPDVQRQLLKQRILIRDCSNFAGLSVQYIRISLKTRQANRRLTEALMDLMASTPLSTTRPAAGCRRI